jgi:diguanylate cyclase (GGDEF)-like protein
MAGAGSITFVAGALLVIGAWAVAALDLPGGYRPFTAVLAEPLALLLVVLAWRFRRSRLAVAALLVAVANLLVRGPLEAAVGDPFHPGSAALALLLPVNLGLVVLTRDHPLKSAGPLVHVGVILLQPWLVAAALLLSDRLSWPTEPAAGWLRLAATPQAALLASLIAATFAALAFAARRSTYEIAILWVVVASALAIGGDRTTHQSTLLLAAAQLVLLFALIEDSYRLAYHDPLTGLPGRRALDEALRTLDGDFVIAMVDIDHFKKFNDRYGHEVGDQALRMVADELGRVGGGGRVHRYGGEEFAIVFPNRSPAQAADHLELLRAAVEDRTFSVRSPDRPRKKPSKPVAPKSPTERVTVTVSVGAAGSSLHKPDPQAVLKAADDALYRAKRRGRNRVVVDGVRAKPKLSRSRSSR